MTQSTVPSTGAPSAGALSAEEVAAIRADFPYLERPARNGEVLAYLVWAATSQKPASVITTEADFYRTSNGAAGRSTYQLADEATATFEDARDAVAAFVGARGSELVFTKNATEAINLVALAIGHASLGRSAARGGGVADSADPARRLIIGEGDEVVVSRAEHHANLVPWQELCARTGATLRWLDLTEDGRIDTSTLDVITERTRVLALTHASNVTGAIADVPRFVSLAQKVGALTVLDACQSVPHMPVDFPTLGVDFAAFSGHKMLAPTGIGALYGRAELLDALPPFLTGGSMITRVELQDADYMPAPIKFEAGTQRVSQAVAFAEAVRYLQHLGMDNVHAWEQELGARLVAGVQNIEGVRLLGPTDPNKRAGLVSLGIDGVHPHDAGQLLDTKGIAVRVGHHCAQPLHRGAGLTASTRASAYLYNTTEDIDAFLAALAEVRPYFGL